MKCSKPFDDDDVLNPDLSDENVPQLTVSDHNEINIYADSLLVSSNHNSFFPRWESEMFNSKSKASTDGNLAARVVLNIETTDSYPN